MHLYVCVFTRKRIIVDATLVVSFCLGIHCNPDSMIIVQRSHPSHFLHQLLTLNHCCILIVIYIPPFTALQILHIRISQIGKVSS